MISSASSEHKIRFVFIPLASLPERLKEIKRQIQLGHIRLAVGDGPKIGGYLIPLKDLEPIIEDEWIDEEKIENITLTQFRSKMVQCYQRLDQEVDCFRISLYTPAHQNIAFISNRFRVHLPIPIANIRIDEG
jgi:hypothetical protein